MFLNKHFSLKSLVLCCNEFELVIQVDLKNKRSISIKSQFSDGYLSVI